MRARVGKVGAVAAVSVLALSCSGRGEIIPTPSPASEPTTAPEGINEGGERANPGQVEAVTVTEPTLPPIPPTTEPATTQPTYPSPPTSRNSYVQPTIPVADIWWQLALCETGGTNADTGNGYSGYFQFLDSTWRSVGYFGRAVDHNYETQVAGAQILQSRSGWGQWPSCSRQLGLR